MKGEGYEEKSNEDSVDGNDDAYGYYHVYYGCSGFTPDSLPIKAIVLTAAVQYKSIDSLYIYFQNHSIHF